MEKGLKIEILVENEDIEKILEKHSKNAMEEISELIEKGIKQEFKTEKIISEKTMNEILIEFLDKFSGITKTDWEDIQTFMEMYFEKKEKETKLEKDDIAEEILEFQKKYEEDLILKGKLKNFPKVKL